MNKQQKQAMLLIYAFAAIVIFLPEISKFLVVCDLMEDSVAEDIDWIYTGGTFDPKEF